MTLVYSESFRRYLRRSLIPLALCVAACNGPNEPGGDPRALDGSWSGSSGTTGVRLHIRYEESEEIGFWGPYTARVLRYSGHFTEGVLSVADTVHEQLYSLGGVPDYAFHPATFNLISYSGPTSRYEFYFRGEPVGRNELRGLLFRRGGPYNTEWVVDSSQLSLRR